jgi:cell shape-determining protein MreC
MKPDDLKSKFNLRNFLFFTVFSSILLLTNITSWNQSLYSVFDRVFNPFIATTRNFALNVKIFGKEFSQKDEVLKENIELRRQLTKYREIESVNKDLKDQIEKLKSEAAIQTPRVKGLRMVEIVGAESIFSNTPSIIIRSGKSDGVEKNDPVYYESNTLLGFVDEVYDDSAKVVPFYSSAVDFRVPVMNLKDLNQRSFISGFQGGVIKVANISTDAKVYEGDTWVTTNDVAQVPGNLVVGTVKKVNRVPQESFISIDLEVPFSLSNTTYVLIKDK